MNGPTLAVLYRIRLLIFVPIASTVGAIDLRTLLNFGCDINMHKILDEIIVV